MSRYFNPLLYLVTDSGFGKPVEEVVALAARGGVTMVQLREKMGSPREIVEKGRRLSTLLRPLGIPLILNDYPELVVDAGADGVHLGPSDVDPKRARAILPPGAILGLSVESLTDIDRILASGADYLAISPVFTTATKSDVGVPLGLEGISFLRRRTKLPIVGIGGIHAGNAAGVMDAGADGIAVVSAIFTHADPGAAAKELVRALQRRPLRLLTIAGSDSGGGAGIQADLKTFEALGGFGMTAITALTAQNTLGVSDVHPVPLPHVRAQIEAVASDIGVDAVKIGMLYSADLVRTVASAIRDHAFKYVVLDPVMVAKGGARLLEDSAIDALRKELAPLVTLLTPNLPEASALLGRPIAEFEMETASRDLLEICPAVLLKGGHLEADVITDILSSRNGPARFWQSARLATANTHGTGCTLSAAIAVELARGRELASAVDHARDYLQGALRGGAKRKIGGGHGPLDHHWQLRREL